MKYLLSHIFYYIGHAVYKSKVMDIWPTEFAHPYFMYSKLMVWSIEIQGDGQGPWGRINNGPVGKALD